MIQPHAAGALVSTVGDLLLWTRALHGGKLLSASSYRQMTTPEGKAWTQYGFGIARETFRGRDVLQHNGGIFGVSTLCRMRTSRRRRSPTPSHRPSAVGAETSARMLAPFAMGAPYSKKKAVLHMTGLPGQWISG